jgi:hypothetical protein
MKDIEKAATHVEKFIEIRKSEVLKKQKDLDEMNSDL